MTTSEVFSFTEITVIDNGIERCEDCEYEPIVGTNLNSLGDIRIVVPEQNLFTLPSKTYLLFEGQLVKLADGKLLQIMVLYTTSTAVLTDNTGFAARQQYIIQKPTTNGTFSFCVPLRHIFGFCDDYDKVIYGHKHTITLTRQSDNNAIFRLAAAAAGKVNFTKISLFIPSVTSSLEEEKKIDYEIKRKVKAPLSFRMRQCDTHLFNKLLHLVGN
ncbi:uncharacterized protein LOC136086840 [Hydra vulgaris]|uniref:Uncharacterized protein LOC136086840 n=1 Tax=Hydra vulgaris TaxID=6087 RepID=A0ABM4CTY9_HYDVU